ncbi:DUF1993 domain-containing protein [Candidatus Viadribacter manganicus]|uniref:DUF1993 domain-containing protein n=1 Tax=Candidatus Viadribacter manganicus TaxID=1759059 RepID=A0A1B1AG76_9PROT|nr:DUF1993 domain-containing protein [Candidatus Viadribacter manganicus]ANP45560.1 hypothetical protein ATE48_06340 [Candidatus Viadribacter manganicus]
MTKLSMHAVSAPVFVRMLKNLSSILTSAEKQAKAKGYDPTVLLNARLAPDMFPLTRQIQIATDHAKGCVARLAGKQIEAIEDTETTFAELQARIAKVLAMVESYQPEQFEGAENREITIKIPNMELKFSGLDYVNQWAMPNFYFHCVTAYDILRANGIDLGKKDFLIG